MTIEALKVVDRKVVMREEIQNLYDRVMAGEIEGLVYVYEDKTGYRFGRLHISFEVAVGLLSRAIHMLNMEWDRRV